MFYVIEFMFNSNIKFKFKLYSNYIKIVYIIIQYLFINQYVYNQLES